MTFSLVAYDQATGMTGVAVATKHLAVGALVPHARPGLGAIATQAQTNPLLGMRGLQLLEQDLRPDHALERLLLEDPDRDERQVHLVDCTGRTAAWTGRDCIGWAGHRTFEGFSVAGNMLTGPETIEAMAAIYQRTAGLRFSERLLLALEAGEAAGGDRRGRQSAALYVMNGEAYSHLDLRVDHSEDPLASLRVLWQEYHKDYYQSFRRCMPTEHRVLEAEAA